jgi:predicted MFS family arabinose efflux permease
LTKNEAGKSFGFHKAMDNSGAILGPLLAWGLLTIFPFKYNYVFLFSTIPAILGVISIVFFIREKHTKQRSTNTNSYRNLSRKYYYFLIIIFVFSLGNSTDALLLVKTSETGIKSSSIPFIYMIFNTVSVLLSIPAGKLSDRKGREKLIIAGFMLYAIVYFMFGFFSHAGILILAFVLYGAYSALTDSAQKAMVSDLTGKEMKGTGFGIYHALMGITLLPASLIAGIMYDKIGSSAPFYFGAAMSCLSVILLFFFIRHYKTADNQ